MPSCLAKMGILALRATPEAGDGQQHWFPGLPCPRQMLDLSKSPGLQLLRVPLKDQPWHFHQGTGASEVAGASPPFAAHPEPGQTCHGPPLSGTIPWAVPGFLCLTDTQVCRAPHMTWGFLGFLPAGQLREDLLFYHSGKPKYNRCEGQFQQNIGIGAPWNWLQRQLAKQACGYCPPHIWLPLPHTQHTYIPVLCPRLGP